MIISLTSPQVVYLKDIIAQSYFFLLITVHTFLSILPFFNITSYLLVFRVRVDLDPQIEMTEIQPLTN